MFVSKKALSKLIPEILNTDDNQIIASFNNCGCEVERIIKHDRVNNLVIGKILKVEDHPNANKLHVATIQLDEQGTIHTIVCGASNLQQDKYVIVALNGARMVDGRVIEYKELRGVLSQGMICAYSEITKFTEFLSKDEDKNIILLDNATIGDADVYKYIGFDDTIYELSLPANRNDLNSIYSICVELSGYFNWNFKNEINDVKFNTNNQLKIELLDNMCNGCAYLELKDVEIKESNWSIKSFLMNNGITPINNILDLLALISLYTNTSIVTYDSDKVGSSITVGLSKQELDATINSKNYSITKADIILKNKNNTIGLAGIAAFDEFAVNKNTKNILVEIGNYDFIHIRNTIMRLSLSIDNGRRLTKPLSNWHLKQALGLFSEVFKDSSIYLRHEYLPIPNPKKIQLNLIDVNSFLGTQLSEQDIKQGLIKYGYQIDNDYVIIPPYRIDLSIPQELYEEVLKIVDVNKIKGVAVKAEFLLNNSNLVYNKTQEVRQLLKSNYFTETRSYNLTSKDNLEEFNLFRYTDFVKIITPLNSAREYCKSNLLHSLLEVYKYNLSYKNKLQPIFETQKIYLQDKVVYNLTAICEEKNILDKVNKSLLIYNISSLRSIIDSIGNIFNTTFDYFQAKNTNVFYDDEALGIYTYGQLVGYIGKIKQSKLKKFDLYSKDIYAFTINLDLLLDMYQPSSNIVKYKGNLIPVYKDISFITKLNSNTSEILKTLNSIKFIDSYEFIDLFALENNNYSYTLRVYFHNDVKLSSKEIEQYMSDITNRLIEQHCIIKK